MEGGHSEKFEFSHLFEELANAHGLVIGPYKVLDLPVLLVDTKEGQFFAYTSTKSMEEAKTFTMQDPAHKGKIVFTDQARKGESPGLDLSITNLVCFQWIAMILLIWAFKKAGGRYKKEPNKAPRGIQNLLETVVVYIRDEIVAPNITNHKTADRLLPYFVGLFFFILLCNLMGLIPGGHTATGAIGTTAGLAVIAFFVINWTAIRESGIGNWLKHLLGGAPVALAPIMIPIEILSMFIKPFALTIRLFANMTAGHVILLSLIGLIFYFQSLAIAPISVAFSLFIYALELLVALLQAFIFTVLTAVFVGLAIGEHGSHEEHSEAH